MTKPTQQLFDFKAAAPTTSAISPARFQPDEEALTAYKRLEAWLSDARRAGIRTGI